MTQKDNFDVAAIMGGLYGDGIIACKGAFTTRWADTLHREIMSLFKEASAIEGGALPRGPERWYVEVQPERIGGFVDIATHPWFIATQFHPEFTSTPRDVHPLFTGFIRAARAHRASQLPVAAGA